MKKFKCSVCGYIYNEATGVPENQIAPNTKFDELPENWVCPLCGASKPEFDELKDEQPSKIETSLAQKEHNVTSRPKSDTAMQLSIGQLSTVFSNLANASEKQDQVEMSSLFQKLAEYYQLQNVQGKNVELKDLLDDIKEELDNNYPEAFDVVRKHDDRGSLRALTWSEKVTRIHNSLIARFEREKVPENTNIFVCEACGFVYVGNTLPEICPVCKAPSFKMKPIAR
ncbi:MAG: rubredoxin [Victivallaceae bacterium]|nr:rubredoxin [Victivallaceae bacterium]